MIPIKKFIFGKSAEITNPYVKGAEGRQEWNDRYFNLSKAVGQWRTATFGLICLALILTGGLVKIAMQSRIQPFIVETNEGMPYTIKTLTSMSISDARITNFAVNQFILNSRTVLSDAEGEKELLNKVYAFSADRTLLFLRDYYAKNNPFEAASQNLISVNIINSMPLSPTTWQVTWDEIKKSPMDGRILDTTRFMANLTLRFGKINPKFINENPFGIFITNVSWSQSQTHS